MKPTKLRVSLGFTKLADDTIIAFAKAVHALLFGEARYTDPPVTAVEFLADITAMESAKVPQANGGKAATATKNTCRETLVNQLLKLAYYVQLACDNDLTLLLDSGFEPTSSNRTRVALAKPTIARIVAGMSGEALVTVTAETKPVCNEVRVAEIDENNQPGPFRPSLVRTGSRNLSVADLIPGKLYLFQARGVGGLNGFSDWSDAVVQRAS
ncbi:MAG: hypothetical protein ABIT37_00915 [Luteolibacter sp.]